MAGSEYDERIIRLEGSRAFNLSLSELLDVVYARTTLTNGLESCSKEQVDKVREALARKD